MSESHRAAFERGWWSHRNNPSAPGESSAAYNRVYPQGARELAQTIAEHLHPLLQDNCDLDWLVDRIMETQQE